MPEIRTCQLPWLTCSRYIDQRQPHSQTSKKRQAIKDRQGAATKRPMQPKQGPESTNSETFGTPMQVGAGLLPPPAAAACLRCAAAL